MNESSWQVLNQGKDLTAAGKFSMALDEADAVLIGAGAGMAAADGFTYAGPRFTKRFPDFIEKYHWLEMKLMTERIGLFEQQNIISGFSDKLIIDERTITRKHHKHLEDKLDAVLCALGLYLIHEKLAVPIKFGTDKDGFILIPELLKY